MMLFEEMMEILLDILASFCNQPLFSSWHLLFHVWLNFCKRQNAILTQKVMAGYKKKNLFDFLYKTLSGSV
jgi:hypothetical protein